MDLQTRNLHFYPIYPEDDMPESQLQRDLADRLVRLIENFAVVTGFFVTGNVQIVPRDDLNCSTIVPDVMFFPGLVLTAQEREALTSWNMNEPNRPAPAVVFEVSSQSTWQNDLYNKPEHYRMLGTQEYFACDPRGFWRVTGETRKLRGWHYPVGSLEPVELEADEQGRLWSEVLQSYLVADGSTVRLYDQEMRLRLTGEEAAELARQEAAQQIELNRQEAERQIELSRQEAELSRQEAELSRQEAELSRKQVERLAQRLRDLNLNPDE